MTDIILAEFSGNTWLVRGEQHVDALLANTLLPDVSIELVACESKSAVNALFHAAGGDDVADMWLIHPAIVNRVRSGTGRIVIRFAAWSAALDDSVPTVLQSLAAIAAERPDAAVTLSFTLPPDAPPLARDMASLRCALVEAQLTRRGVAAQRLVRTGTPDGEPDTVTIAVG